MFIAVLWGKELESSMDRFCFDLSLAENTVDDSYLLTLVQPNGCGLAGGSLLEGGLAKASSFLDDFSGHFFLVQGNLCPKTNTYAKTQDQRPLNEVTCFCPWRTGYQLDGFSIE